MTIMENRSEAPVELVTLSIDGVEVSVPKGTMVIRAAEVVGIEIPRFCDHPLLDPVGACRQCLVDVPDAGNGRGFPKPQASCSLEVAPGMVVNTQLTSPVAAKAQTGIMEFLLINHPLDCPVCDKGGECPLQNQALSHGRDESRFEETKRTFDKPLPISAQVLLDRERCVLCARCTRFSNQIAGDPLIALTHRGALQQIGIYENEPFESYFAGNTIQICPVGALTSADYRFRARPFDLSSVPSVAEHDACGAAIRIDHRRGKVMRRLSGNDSEVNEEWISDKDRFAFTWSRGDDRLSVPLVRNPETGELEPASWPGALAAAARGLSHKPTGVLPGGRLTAEDAYAYSKFARAVLNTNDIDFRSRYHSEEEAQFLAAHVVAKPTISYDDFSFASTVVLVGFEPEDEAATVFLRLRKAVRGGLKVIAIASHATKGLRKLDGELMKTKPGDEAVAIAALDIDADAILLVGERLAQIPGALSAVSEKVSKTGAKLAWIPRRAGDRGALEAGCLPNLLPGGRPVADSTARADLAAAWSVDSLAAEPGRNLSQILSAAAAGDLEALVIGGVEIADLPDRAQAIAALEKAFVVSLEVRHSEVTDYADVVLPVAPPVEKSGSFITWDGRVRRFDTVLDVPNSLPDVRVLAGIAEELDSNLGFRTIKAAREELDQVGPWDGDYLPAPEFVSSPAASGVLLDTWKQLIDDGRGQDGQVEYKMTARPAVIKASAATLAAASIKPGDIATISTAHGSVSLTTQVADMADDVVWVPTNNGSHITSVLGVSMGQPVTLKAGGA